MVTDTTLFWHADRRYIEYRALVNGDKSSFNREAAGQVNLLALLYFEEIRLI